MDLGVYITLKDDERLVGECIRRARKVFPQVVVYDIGSIDGSIRNAEQQGAEVRSAPPIKAAIDYTTWKNEIGEKHDYVFWIDADEWWPETALLNVRDQIELGADLVAGYWRNLREEDERLLVSSPTTRGRVAWDTRIYHLCRAWPRERLCRKDGEEMMNNPGDPAVYCWHGVLLKRTSVPEGKARRDKRLFRIELFQKLEWRETSWENISNDRE